MSDDGQEHGVSDHQQHDPRAIPHVQPTQPPVPLESYGQEETPPAPPTVPLFLRHPSPRALYAPSHLRPASPWWQRTSRPQQPRQNEPSSWAGPLGDLIVGFLAPRSQQSRQQPPAPPSRPVKRGMGCGTAFVLIVLVCCALSFASRSSTDTTTSDTSAPEPTATSTATETPLPPILMGATLGGTPAGFAARFGLADSADLYHGTVSGQPVSIIVTVQAGIDGGDHVTLLNVMPDDFSVRWDDATAQAVASALLPSDSTHVTDGQAFNGYDHIYRSGLLAATFPAAYFYTDRDSVPVPSGTLHFQCFPLPAGSSGIARCVLEVGQAQVQSAPVSPAPTTPPPPLPPTQTPVPVQPTSTPIQPTAIVPIMTPTPSGGR